MFGDLKMHLLHARAYVLSTQFPALMQFLHNHGIETFISLIVNMYVHVHQEYA